MTPTPLIQRISRDVAEFTNSRGNAGALLAEVSNSRLSNRYLAGLIDRRLAIDQQVVRNFYDIAVPLDAKVEADRDVSSQIGGLSLLFIGLINDHATTIPDAEDKIAYFDLGTTSLTEGRVPKRSEYAMTPLTHAARATFELGAHIHGQVTALDVEEQFTEVTTGLVTHVKQQLQSRDVEQQLLLTQEIGVGIGVFTDCVIRLVAEDVSPALREAVTGLSTYAHFLETAYSVDGDIAHGTVNYATLFLEQNGDQPTNRRLVQENLAIEAKKWLHAGKQGLSESQTVIYRAAQSLIRRKHQLYERTINTVQRTPSALRYEPLPDFDTE